jgi:hypothetical protein
MTRLAIQSQVPTVECRQAGTAAHPAADGSSASYLIDEGFLDRLPDGSRWWRCGGNVDLDPDLFTTAEI